MSVLPSLRSLVRGVCAVAGLFVISDVAMAGLPRALDPGSTMPPSVVAGDRMDVFVVLEAPPAVKTDLAAKSLAHATRVELVRERLQEIDAEQEVLLLALKSLGAQEVARHRRLTNAIQVRMPAGQVPLAAQLPGVVRVEPVPHQELHVDSSVPFIGAPSVWDPTGLGVHGEGVRVGIVDTGIDYYHAGLGGAGNPADYSNDDRTVIEPGSFPTARVVGGHDFVGDNYNSNSQDPGQYTPVPDPDPLDCQGHGSHVAGIAAGNGVLLNGTAYTGPWDDTLNPADFLVPPGVAPAVDIYALKVFGCPGGAAGSTSTQMIVSALEWAADPNDDGDFSDRLDVVNLSLGGAFGGITSVEAEAVRHLAELGCIVVGSAGNNGNTFHVAGGVAMYPESIGVANIADDGLRDPFLTVSSPQAIAGEYKSPQAGFGPRFPEGPALAGQLVLSAPAEACEPLTNPGQISGKIAVVARGGCPFVDKVRNVQAAGAIAMVVINNSTDPPFAMGGSGNDISIPSVMISQADGNTISTHLSTGVQASFPVRAQPELARQVAGSSSRGPAMIDYRLKPDLAAPGTRIDSVAFGTGTGANGLTGTSMSAPHVAGAAAILKQLHPSDPVFMIKSRLMNTSEGAVVEEHVSPESRTGAGSMRLDRAASSNVVAYNRDRPAEVSISWGFLELTEPATISRHVEVLNASRVARAFNVGVSQGSTQGGITVSVNPSAVNIPAFGSTVIEVTLEANPSLFTRTVDPTTGNQAGLVRSSLYEVSGNVVLTGGGDMLRVPYYAAVEAASKSSLPPVVYLGKSAAQAAEKTIVPMVLPVAEEGAHPQPLVSAFQLAYEREASGYEDPWMASKDLIAVGVASNVGVLPNYNQGTLYFAVAMDGSWAAPNTAIVPVEISVSAVGNSNTWIQYSESYARATGQGNSDTFIVVRYREDPPAGFIDHLVNFFAAHAPAQPDTGLYNNSVMVMPVSVSALGVSAANPVVEFQVTTFDPITRAPVIQSPPLQYDFRKRPIPTTTQGIANTPFQNPAGGTVTYHVDHDSLAANPDLNRILILHHHNLPGERVQVVEVSPDAAPISEADAWMIF